MLMAVAVEFSAYLHTYQLYLYAAFLPTQGSFLRGLQSKRLDSGMILQEKRQEGGKRNLA